MIQEIYRSLLLAKPFTSVPLSANLSIGMSAMIKAQSLNLLVGFE